MERTKTKRLSAKAAIIVSSKEELQNLPWIILQEDMRVSDGLTTLPKGTRVKLFRNTNGGFVRIHPDTSGITQFIWAD